MIEQHPANLSKLQHTFKDLVWRGEKPAERPGYLKESLPIDWKTRVGVYQYAVKERIVESLEEDFETVRALMGKHEFRLMLEDFLKSYPSKYASLGEVSQNIGKFLKEYPATKEKPYLSELGELEWNLIKASLCENLTENNLAELQRPENQGRDILFLLHDSVNLFNASHPVHLFFENKSTGIQPNETYLVIFQKDRAGYYHEVEKEEWLLLKAVSEKKSLNQLNQTVVDNQIPPEKLGEYFSNWSTSGWIVAFNAL